MLRIAGSLMVLALAFGGGCSGPDDSGGAAATGGAIEARAVSEIWADILTQRDRVQVAVAKGTEMWHEDCEEVASAAAALDALANELGKRVAETPSFESRRLGLQEVVGYLQVTATTLRTKAVEEIVGDLPAIMIGLDYLLQNMEGAFTREEIGSESIVKRPGFNPVRPPPPPSPV